MSEIEPGEGYRLIDNQKDRPIKGDQAWCGPGWWRDRFAWDRPFNKSVVYRRRKLKEEGEVSDERASKP